MKTTHSFNWRGCSWRVEIDNDHQYINWVECNGEPFDAAVDDYIAIKDANTFKIEHVLNALYDAALNIDPQ